MTLKESDAFSPGKTPPFEESARESLSDSQLRRNIGKATQTIRRKRADAVEEMPDWEQLRETGRALKSRTMRHLDDVATKVLAHLVLTGLAVGIGLLISLALALHNHQPVGNFGWVFAEVYDQAYAPTIRKPPTMYAATYMCTSSGQR